MRGVDREVAKPAAARMLSSHNRQDLLKVRTYVQIELRPIVLAAHVFTTVVMLPYQKNTTFSRCSGNRKPTQQAPCDPGAAAFDEQEGDLSAVVTITPAVVSLEAPIGTRIRLAYRVSDNGIPRRSAVAYRIAEISTPCRSGQFFCSGDCVQVRALTTPQWSCTERAPALEFSSYCSDCLLYFILAPTVELIHSHMQLAPSTSLVSPEHCQPWHACCPHVNMSTLTTSGAARTSRHKCEFYWKCTRKNHLRNPGVVIAPHALVSKRIHLQRDADIQVQVPCTTIGAINAEDREDAATAASLPPMLHFTRPLPPRTAITDPLIATYGAAPAFSLQPCNSTQLPASASTAKIAALTLATCAAYATNSTGAVLPGTRVAPAGAYCDSATCVACTDAALAAGQCLPGVHVFAYSAPEGAYAWPNGTTAAVPIKLLAVAVAEVAGFTVQVNFPATDAAAADALAAALTADSALLAHVASGAEAQAFASLNGTAAGNGTGQLLDVRTNGTHVFVEEPGNAGGSYAAVLEVSLEFRYVPGLQSYLTAWPQGATSISTSASAGHGTSGRRRLMRAGGTTISDHAGQIQTASMGTSVIWGSRLTAPQQLTLGGAGRAPGIYDGWPSPGRSLHAFAGRSLQQISLVGLQSLLVGVLPSGLA